MIKSKSKQNINEVLIWNSIREEALEVIEKQKIIADFVRSSIIKHACFPAALSFCLAKKLSACGITEKTICRTAFNSYAANKRLTTSAFLDIIAVKERDPACSRYIEPLLYFKGFQALQAYRLANFLYENGDRDFALFIQMRTSEIFGVDIHPNARIGESIMIDHAHCIVIGETAVIGDNVSMLHSVTLGGTGKQKGDRHPKIGSGVLLGAGASVLGNISIGRCSKVASGSVVLSDVPEFKTVAGVPAKIVGPSGCDQPATEMDHNLSERFWTN